MTNTASHGEALRVLIVEDDFLVAMEVEAGLAAAGFAIVGVAATAEDAVRLAQVERPHLAIMDIRLASARDGVDAALEIFQSFGIRSLFATAHRDDRTLPRAMPARAIGWVQKPYLVETLVTEIEAARDELGAPR